MSNTLNLVRPDLRDLRGYVAAAPDRDMLRLHANESPYDSGGFLNHYPEPQPQELITRLADLYGVGSGNVLATRGSDDAIDLLVRCFCRAGVDSILICPPTFGMYAVAARLQNAQVRVSPLDKTNGFSCNADAVIAACTESTRLVFLCSPNNPTGNLVSSETVESLCERLAATTLIVIDEAYIEYASADSFTTLTDQYSNLVILRTLSKAHALAGARCGALIATPEIINAIRPAMPPYSLPTLTTRAALVALSDGNLQSTRQQVATICVARQQLRRELEQLSVVRRTWPSEANFILAQVCDKHKIINGCRANRILIRDMAGQPGLDQHVRISVGTAAQNRQLLTTLESVA